MKTTQAMTFEELVEWAAGHILKELIKGDMYNAVYAVCLSAANWKQAQEEEKNKSKAKKYYDHRD